METSLFGKYLNIFYLKKVSLLTFKILLVLLSKRKVLLESIITERTFTENKR